MIAVVNHNSVSATQALLDTAPRRRIEGEITNLRAEIIELKKAQNHQAAHNDAKTRLIETWVNNFIAAFRTKEEIESIQQEFIILLETILADPLLELTQEILGFEAFYVPVDAEALIGSDSETYGRKTLSIFLNSVPVILRNRSPLHPEDGTPFITNPHRVIRRVVEWLETKKPLLNLPEIENAFNTLNEDQLISPFSEWENAQFRQISESMSKQAEDQNQLIGEMWQDVNGLLAEFRVQVEERFRPLRARREAHDLNIKNAVTRSSTKVQIDAKALLSSIQKLEKEIEMIEERNQKYRESLSSANAQISEIVKSRVKLQTIINEVRAGINQYKIQLRKNLIKDGVICFTCVLGTYGLGGNGLIFPSKGGAMFKSTIPI